MLKKSVSLLLGLCLVLGTWAASAQEPNISHIDELPFLAQSRPDMALPEPLSVTLTEKYLLLAPAGGKDIYKNGGFAMRDTNQGYPAKWSSKQKAYLVDYVKAGINPSDFDQWEFVYQKKLKKDTKISKQIQDRALDYRFSAATGQCEKVNYQVLLKTKEGQQLHTLSHQASGVYLARFQDQTQTITRLFDKAGQAIPIPQVVVPDSPEGIEGLPDMDGASIRYHVPVNPQESFWVKADAGWESVYLDIGSVYGSIGEMLSYNEGQGAWISKPLSEIKGLMDIKDRLSTIRMGLKRQLNEGETFTWVISFRPEFASSMLRSVLENKVSYEEQPDVDEGSYAFFERKNQYGFTELAAKRSAEKLEVQFFDLAGNLHAQKEYPMPKLGLPEDFETITEEMVLSQLQAQSQPGSIAHISEITSHPMTKPEWTPVLKQEDTKWSLTGVAKNINDISALVYKEEHRAYFAVTFEGNGSPVLQGEDLLDAQRGYVGEIVFHEKPVKGQLDLVKYVYNTDQGAWARCEITVRKEGEPIEYQVERSFDQPGYRLICFGGAVVGSVSEMWSAEYDPEGKLIPGSLSLRDFGGQTDAPAAPAQPAASVPEPAQHLSDITTQAIVTPSWTPVLVKEEAKWSVEGLPEEMDEVLMWVDNGDGSSTGNPLSPGPVPTLRGAELAQAKKGFNGKIDFMKITAPSEEMTHTYDAKQNAWLASTLAIRKAGGLRYTVMYTIREQKYWVGCHDDTDPLIWCADYDAEGNMIPGTLWPDEPQP